MSIPRDKRLLHDYESMERLKAESSLIDFEAKGSPPEEYLVLFKCKGLVDEGVVGEEHLVWIYLHAEYPRKPPIVRWKTPIFHPNVSPPKEIDIKHPVTGEPMKPEEILGIMDRLGLERPERITDLTDGRVCLDILDLNWTATVTLDRLCLELGEMIQYKKFNLDDPLDHEAAEWAEENMDEFPIDDRELLDFRIELGEEEKEDIDIRLY